MRLNGSALNRRRLNGGRRMPVLGSGHAVAGVITALAATRIVHGAGDTVHHLAADFLASAVRMGVGGWVCTVDAGLDESVIRNGTGQAVLELAADLFYSRTVLGFGSAVLDLELQGHVGVVFIEGAATIRPMLAELDAAKRVLGRGSAAVGLVGSLAPSAVRRVTGELVPLQIAGALEASHIDADGVRYIGGAGDAQLRLRALDAGMLRQAFIGSLDFELQGTGSGSLIKPTLAGQAVMRLGLECDFHVIRRFDGAAALRLLAEGQGAVIVRGEGAAVLQVLASATGYKRTFPTLAAAVATVTCSLDGARVALGGGDAALAFGMAAEGVRRRFGTGVAVIEVLAESDAYLNPNAEDPAEETFARLPEVREFSRPEAVREWRR